MKWGSRRGGLKCGLCALRVKTEDRRAPCKGCGQLRATWFTTRGTTDGGQRDSLGTADGDGPQSQRQGSASERRGRPVQFGTWDGCVWMCDGSHSQSTGTCEPGGCALLRCLHAGVALVRHLFSRAEACGRWSSLAQSCAYLDRDIECRMDGDSPVNEKHGSRGSKYALHKARPPKK